MQQVYKFDQNGYYIKPVILNKDEQIYDDCTKVQPPDGLYRAKWNGIEWIEDMTQEEIDELNNQPSELTEIEKLKISQAEQFETMLMVIGGM